MLKSKTVGYRKYIIRDTIPNINTINEKRIPMQVNRGMLT